MVRRSFWHRGGRLSLLTVVVVLAAGIVWGVGSAVAASPAASPSSAPGQVVLLASAGRQEPDNLNVVHRLQCPRCWEVWALNYDYLFGSGQHNQPALDLAKSVPDAAERWHLGRRQGLDDPHQKRCQVPGRGAADRLRRRLHLQLRDQERHRLSTPPTSICTRCPRGQGARPHHRAAHLRPSHGRRLHGVAVGADPAGAHLDFVRHRYRWRRPHVGF